MAQVNNGVEEISEKEFNSKIKNKLLAVDFFAEWCMPCLMMAPVFSEVAEKFDGKVEFAKVNIDDNSSLASKFGVMSIPTIILFKNGKEEGRITGAVSSERLEEKLNDLLR